MVLWPARVESWAPVRKGMEDRGLITDGGCDPGYVGVQLRRILQQGYPAQALQTRKARERERFATQRAFRGLAQLSSAPLPACAGISASPVSDARAIR